MTVETDERSKNEKMGFGMCNVGDNATSYKTYFGQNIPVVAQRERVNREKSCRRGRQKARRRKR